MRKHAHRTTVCLAATWLVFVGFTQARAGRTKLPAKAANAIKTNFPKAKVTGIGRERENGVMYYEVNLKENGKRFEVEVTPDGAIGEIEAKLGLKDLPKDVREIVAKATKGARRIRIEMHERRGRARNGTFVPLPQPTVRYEVKYSLSGRRRRLWLDAKEIDSLPKRAKDAVAKAFPKATITDVKLEYENGAGVYEVELTQNGKAFEVKVSTRGTLMEIETRVARSKLPPPVAETVKKHAKGCRVMKVEEVELRAVVKGGKVTKLREPKLFYEVEVSKGGREAEIKVSPSGKLLEEMKWEDDEDDDDDDDDDD